MPGFRSAGAAVIFAVTGQVLALPAPAYAQTPVVDTDIYKPGVRNASSPMRVVVLSPTSFQDIETHQVYRLYGVDACDATQTATLGKQTWPCGTVAMAWTVNATLNKWIVCSPIRKDGEVIVGRCATGEMPDVAADMLKAGIAVTLPDEPDRRIPTYAALEREARKSFRGIWASTFQMPWLFRKSTPARP